MRQPEHVPPLAPDSRPVRAASPGATRRQEKIGGKAMGNMCSVFPLAALRAQRHHACVAELNALRFGAATALLDVGASPTNIERSVGRPTEKRVDVYFSADVETDGPIPGPFSLLSFALVYAGRFDGARFEKPATLDKTFYRELRPISDEFETEALAVNGLDRDRLVREGDTPASAMTAASEWIRGIAGVGQPVLVAYPLSFDWAWLYWYFVRFGEGGSPFDHSRCFDIKTAYAVKAHLPIASAGRSQLLPALRSERAHTHHAIDDAKEQADVFAKIMDWDGRHG